MSPANSSPSTWHGQDLNRRRFLQLGAGGLVVIGGGVFAGTQLIGQQAAVSPDSASQTSARGTGTVIRRDLRAAPGTVDLGGRTVQT